VEAARTEKGLFEASGKRAERWRRIARESAQQSRRSTIPEILPAVRFDQALSQDADYRYFLDERAAPPLLSALPSTLASSDCVAVFLGPEGGWTDDERRLALDAAWRAVSLGPQILRAETAAAAATAVLTAAWLTAYNRT
jgi:16S rRNA (uracil1498-N3)-methyltransferase